MKTFLWQHPRIGELSKLVATKKNSAPTRGYNSDYKQSDKDIPTQGTVLRKMEELYSLLYYVLEDCTADNNVWLCILSLPAPFIFSSHLYKVSLSCYHMQL